MRMSSDRSEQHTAERATECKEPVVQAPAHPACGAPKEVGDHHPHLFGEERCPDQAVRPQVRLQCCLRKKGRAGGTAPHGLTETGFRANFDARSRAAPGC